MRELKTEIDNLKELVKWWRLLFEEQQAITVGFRDLAYLYKDKLEELEGLLKSSSVGNLL